ncbi:MAG TPA: ankyrin repeat domain-containing protein, partial [Gammaproteobacteria bacterium]|nr:ankyrin repeat domain-containing protein [Gammaproteobacteria bacterium]
EIAKDFYRIVARDLVSKGFTHKVNCGSLSGISREVGVGEKLGIAEEKFIDYAGYSDSSSQLVLFDKITPFYWYGQDHWYWYGKDTQYTKLKNALFKEELILSEHLANSKLLGHVINWALLHNRKDILDGLQEIAQTVDRSDELHVLINSMKQFIDSPNNFEVEKFVLNNQYYVDTVNSNGNTLLMQACFKGNDKLVYLLSEKGTDVNLINKSGETALHIAASSKTIDKGVITKLIEKGAKINTEDNFGATPLMRAIINKNGTHKVQELLARGADVKAKDHYGNAALMYAAKCGNSAIIPALVQRGAYIDDCDFSGDTPLITAIKKDDVACVVELINNGADVTMQDNVPLTWAECMDNAEIINIIKEKIYEVVKRKTLLFSNNMQPNRAYLSPLDAHDEEDNTRVAEFQIE